MRIARRQRNDLRCEHCSQWLCIGGAVDFENMLDAGQLGSLGRDCRRIGRQHCDVDVADLARAAHTLGDGRIELAAGMLGNDEYLAHVSNPLCLSAAIKPATSFTMAPFWRPAGGSCLSVLNCAVISTPSEAMGTVSSGFFLAFMISGSFT